MEKAIQDISEALNLFDFNREDSLALFKRQFLGKQGVIQSLVLDFRNLSGEDKKRYGADLNALKMRAQELYETVLKQQETQISTPWEDISLPGREFYSGSIHPLRKVELELLDVFGFLGFSVANGPEIEDDWHNFSALNFPENHPARDMQDTFFVEGSSGHVLRTHTSGVQVRTMLTSRPPIRVIAPGRVYRCDSDATHSPVFHQLEGLVVDNRVSFKDMKEVLYHFTERFFGNGFEVRFRPSYFPFTEPSAEMDIGKRESDGTVQWMEILGCGMVDPTVLENCQIDSTKFQGYAFGIGLDRLAMLKYGIKDIRLLYENDLRFLKQFVGI